MSRFQRQQLREEEDADGGQGDTRTVQSRSTVAHSVRSRQDSFAKKFSSSSAVRAETDSHVDRQSDLVAQYTQKLAALSLARSGVSTVATFVKKIPAPVHEEEGEDENSCDDESSNEEGDGWVERTNQPTGRKAETKEEKKLRKQAVS